MSVAHVREQRAPLFPTVGDGRRVLPGARLQRGRHQPRAVGRDADTRLHCVGLGTAPGADARSRIRERSVAARSGGGACANCLRYVDRLLRSASRARGAQRDLQASLERLTRYVTTIEALEKSGRMITNDVLKFRTARDNAELALDAARSNTERATATLGILIGEPNQPDLDIADHHRGAAEADGRSRAESGDAGGAARDRVGQLANHRPRKPSACRPSRSRSRPASSASIHPRPSRTTLADRTTGSCRCRCSTAG